MIKIKRIFKKSLSVLVSAVMIIGLFTIVPFAASAEEASGAAELTANTTELTGGSYTATHDLTVNSRITCNGNVTLILTDGVTLTVHKGIKLTGNTSLTIRGQSNGAGIGSGQYGSAKITLNNGVIENAEGGTNGAAIGAGDNGSGSVTFSGGSVYNAKGGENGAGIGGGNQSGKRIFFSITG